MQTALETPVSVTVRVYRPVLAPRSGTSGAGVGRSATDPMATAARTAAYIPQILDFASSLPSKSPKESASSQPDDSGDASGDPIKRRIRFRMVSRVCFFELKLHFGVIFGDGEWTSVSK